jgi:hypothetical protein
MKNTTPIPGPQVNTYHSKAGSGLVLGWLLVLIMVWSDLSSNLCWYVTLGLKWYVPVLARYWFFLISTRPVNIWKFLIFTYTYIIKYQEFKRFLRSTLVSIARMTNQYRFFFFFFLNLKFGWEPLGMHNGQFLQDY